LGVERGCTTSSNLATEVRAREPHRIRQLIGITGQYASVDEDLTATENLWMFGRLQGLRSADARASAKRLLAQFGLEEAADRPIALHDLSHLLFDAAQVVFGDHRKFIDTRINQEAFESTNAGGG